LQINQASTSAWTKWARNGYLHRFLSYYHPYRRTFFLVMACALAAAAITLVFPLLTRYITKTVLAGDLTNALGEIYKVAVLMVGLVAVQMLCSYIFDYYGHAMGAQMESDLRLELFEHLQRLPLGFYDEARTGELMSRLTNDLFSLAEMYAKLRQVCGSGSDFADHQLEVDPGGSALSSSGGPVCLRAERENAQSSPAQQRAHRRD